MWWYAPARCRLAGAGSAAMWSSTPGAGTWTRTHTSVTILDALNTFEPPVIEVHISNVHKREAFRHHSYVSMRADGVIAGLGTQGYQLALRRVARLIDEAEKGSA